MEWLASFQRIHNFVLAAMGQIHITAFAFLVLEIVLVQDLPYTFPVRSSSFLIAEETVLASISSDPFQYYYPKEAHSSSRWDRFKYKRLLPLPITSLLLLPIASAQYSLLRNIPADVHMPIAAHCCHQSHER